VSPVTGTLASPELEGTGTPIEYAVKMRSFKQDDLWSARLARGVLRGDEIDSLAAIVAAFHQRAERVRVQDPWGNPEVEREIAEENYGALDQLLHRAEERKTVAALHLRDRAARAGLDRVFRQRKREGFVRECHGDLHAANVLTEDGVVQVFDCIEFNERLRWIDVINDIAFTCMDLQRRGRPDHAARLLNAYLERTGDYDGLAVLPYYLAQRALVRCKVALLRMRQAGSPASHGENGQVASCLALAQESMRVRKPVLMIMHGVAGSGKTVFSQRLLERIGAIRLRSDVERKRMHGLAAETRAGSHAYGSKATQATYERLAALARVVLGAGFTTIVDASFLQQARRRAFARLARELDVPFLILDMQAGIALLRSRVAERARAGGDASDADESVLERQLVEREPLSADEAGHALHVNPEAVQGVLERIEGFLETAQVRDE
ncbi:MAG TPA: AAA family ATPase, partial [Noviherbaspirillum sp.]